jgi:hypothetical protein
MVRSTMLAAGTLFLASGAVAASPDLEKCRAITDAAQRLACYDRAAEQAPAVPAPVADNGTPPAPAPSALPPAPPAHARREARESRQERPELASEGRIAAVVPLRHGYFRLELADGTAYNTTVVASPPPVGVEVRIRRTFLGTTFLDIKGWSPIAVKLSRE